MRALGSIWRPGMFTAPRYSVVARCKMGSPVDRLVAEVMSQEPYKSARRVFWIMDNCSAHRGQRAADRFRAQWPNAILIHTPNHASWLNQVEISRFEARALRLSAPHPTANQPAVSRRRQQKSSSASGQSFHIATNGRYPTRWQLFPGGSLLDQKGERVLFSFSR